MRIKTGTIAAVLLLALALGGCDPSSLSPATLQAICTALVGPIKYNTYNRASGRFSGPVLAPDLKQRNQIGRKLGCPQYRTKLFSDEPADYGRKW